MGKLDPPEWSDIEGDFETRNFFWNRYVFDLTFFIIINMLFMKMLFGIIIDTFKELSENKKERDLDIKTKCYICGLTKKEIEKLSPVPNSWHRHVKKVHNVYDMLFYIIKVKDEPLEDCDFLEKYVKE
jgi:hypothetical protein